MKPIHIFFIVVAQFSPLAYASPITYAFGGKFDRATYSDCKASSVNGSCNSWTHTNTTSSTFFNNQEISVGDSFAGKFTYETSSNYALSSDGFQAVYLDLISNFQLNFSDINLPSSILPRAGNGSLSIVNNRYNHDSFFVSQSFSGADWFATSYVSLIDNTGLIYNNFGVPDSISLSDFTSQTLHVGFLRRSDGDQLHLYGQISELVNEVPEPTTNLLLFSALIFLLAKSRKPRPVKASM